MSLREYKAGEKVRINPDRLITGVLPSSLSQDKATGEFMVLDYYEKPRSLAKNDKPSVLLAMPCGVGNPVRIRTDDACSCGKCDIKRWAWWVFIEDLLDDSGKA